MKSAKRAAFNDGVYGVILGAAVGDALGYPIEFLDMPHIHERFGSDGVTGFSCYHKAHVFPPMAPVDVFAADAVGMVPTRFIYPYSDDTQMLIATLRGLMRARTWTDVDAAAEEVAAEYVAWSKSPENNRAPGRSCMAGCAELGRGVHWSEAGKGDAKGCGSAMRSMAYGLWHWGDPDTAAEWAAQHSAMTHASDEAMASAAAVAAGVSWALVCDDRSEVIEVMIRFAGRHDPETADLLNKATGESTLNTPPSEVLDTLRGWRAGEAVAASMYCFIADPSDYTHAVLKAVNSPGDSDSLGCITGSLVGAFGGAARIPTYWREEVENSKGLHVLGYRLIKILEGRVG